MARIEGKIDSITLDDDNDGPACRLHLHSQGLCYEAIVLGAAGVALNHLVNKGDVVALHGPVTFDGWYRDIDVVHVEALVNSEMKKLALGYRNQYAPG